MTSDPTSDPTNDPTNDQWAASGARSVISNDVTRNDRRIEQPENHDADAETITEDAIEYFGDHDGETGSPTSDADAPSPG